MKTESGLLLMGLLWLGSCTQPGGGNTSFQTGKDWPVYGGNKAGNRYSPLDQINLQNVRDLQVAWSYDSNDPPDANGHRRGGEIQCQPIVVHGILYGTTASLKLFALDAGTGKQLWKFDPFKDMNPRPNQNRGVVYWENGKDKRILFTAGPYLYAVNAVTGQGIPGFGQDGKVDLHVGLSVNYDVSHGSVNATSPGVLYQNVLIQGSTVSESGDAPPGYVRGFDVISGKLLWTFHTIPQPGEPGYDSWPKDAYKTIGAVNNWSGLSVDDKRGMVYFGTGSPGSDFYGGERAGKDLFSDCIVALDAETGKLHWYYQTIHHDLWDRDIPCPPNLTTITRNGKKEDVVVQVTKDGLVYVLDRDSGTSVFPVEERPVPTQGLPGESPWPTQKFPLKPKPFSNQVFADSDVTNISPQAHDYVVSHYLQADHGLKFLPPSLQGTLLFGYSGGAEWGGNAVDKSGILYQNANNTPWLLEMISTADRRREIASMLPGEGLYIAHCSTCHGMNRKGNGKEIPNLVNIGARFSSGQISTLLKTGRGIMPSFQRLSDHQREAIIDYLLHKKPAQGFAGRPRKFSRRDSAMEAKHTGFPYDPPYESKVWEKVLDQDGYPGVKPPWGTLNAIDLNTGDYLWRVPLGEHPELTKKGIPLTGTESYGGPIVTAGGLVFIAGTRDERIRAFDKRTGKVVWEYQLPAGGFATPITYEVNGIQYVVIAAGGARGLKPGGWYIAFALPEKDRSK